MGHAVGDMAGERAVPVVAGNGAVGLTDVEALPVIVAAVAGR